MKRFFNIMLAAGAVLISLACGWDWDTIQMEKQQFPDIHELITGKFLRHSQELYYWRIQDRKKRIRSAPDSLALYDDLGMAYDKTGESQKAVEIMLEKEKKKPGLYETYANLGLFYMHAGDMANGVLYVEKALKVNPNAHFGREKYQLHLGKYILERMRGGQLSLPLTAGKKTGFYDYLRVHEFKNPDYKSEAHFNELSDAIKGVAGMMTFANYRSPVLLEALADLLLHTHSTRGAGHLASRAYLKASWESEGEAVAKYYEKAKWAREYVFADRHIWGDDAVEQELLHAPEKGDSITGAIIEHPIFRMDVLEAALKLEVQNAETWFDSLHRDEIAWIKEKKNPDKEFAAKYYEGQKLRTIALNQYEAAAAKNKIDNALWLHQQLTKPVFHAGMPGYKQLPDSTRKMIDSLYKEEEEPEKPSTTEEETGTLENKTESGSGSFLVWMILLIPLLGIFYFFRLKRRKK